MITRMTHSWPICLLNLTKKKKFIHVHYEILWNKENTFILISMHLTLYFGIYMYLICLYVIVFIYV